MASYITVTQFLNMSDVVTVSRLCERGTPGSPPTVPTAPPSASDLQTNAVLAAAILAASGEICSAALQGDRYSDADLQALSGNPQGKLLRLAAQLTMCVLWEDRAMAGVDLPRPEFYDRAHRELERLSRGERVF